MSTPNTGERRPLLYPYPPVKSRSVNIAVSVGISFRAVSYTDFICLSIERVQEMINYQMDE